MHDLLLRMTEYSTDVSFRRLLILFAQTFVPYYSAYGGRLKLTTCACVAYFRGFLTDYCGAMDRDCGTASQVSGRSFKHRKLVNNNFASLMLTWPQLFRRCFLEIHGRQYSVRARK